MTTLVYANGQLSSDSQVTEDNTVVGWIKKIGKTADGHLYGTTGRADSIEIFAKWCETREGDPPNDPDEKGENQSTRVLITPDGRVREWEKFGWSECVAPFFAWGSGANIARGALAAGATIEQAIEVACTYDVYSGGEVQSVRLGPDTQPIEDDDHESGAVEVDPLTPEERAALNAELDKPRPETWRERHGLV